MTANHSLVLLAATALVAAGCAAIKPARMALPEGLEARSESLAVQGLGGGLSGRTGRFTLGADSGTFERSASRLALFDSAVSRDSGSVRYTLQTAAGAVEGECKAAQTGSQVGILSLPVRPWQVACQWRGGARLALQARPGPAGTQEARDGRFEESGMVLELRSEHRLQGSKLPLAQPAGYVFLHQGQAVGALDLADSSKPVLKRPAAGQPLHAAVTQAALALALLWDPAGQ